MNSDHLRLEWLLKDKSRGSSHLRIVFLENTWWLYLNLDSVSPSARHYSAMKGLLNELPRLIPESDFLATCHLYFSAQPRERNFAVTHDEDDFKLSWLSADPQWQHYTGYLLSIRIRGVPPIITFQASFDQALHLCARAADLYSALREAR